MQKVILAILGVLGPATIALAQEHNRSGSALSVQFDTAVTTHYFYHGFLQEDQGMIVQPGLELGVQLSESLALSLGSWNSMHSSSPSGTSGTNTTPSSWYESDFYVGLQAQLSDTIEVSTTYTVLTSPNGAFATQELLDLSLSYDDSGLWGKSGLSLEPSLSLRFELDGASDLGNELGTYLELGIAPGFKIREGSGSPIEVSLPLTLGLSAENYYENALGDDKTFGFLDIGVDLSMALGVPSRFGNWELTAGLHSIHLGSTTETVNGGDSHELIGSVNVSISW